MNAKQQLSLGLLILGLILSSIFRIKFNIYDGFEFHNFWITPVPSIFDFAALSSSELELTTTILGYLSFLIAGILMLGIVRSSKNNKEYGIIIFLIVTCCAIIFEFSSLIQDLNSNFGGKHLRIGLFLFVMSLFLLFKNHKELKIKNKL